jgi:hypothetical protein
MGEEKIIDQSQLAEDIAKKISFEFRDSFLVKPLDPVKVMKEFTKLPEGETPKKDENGVEAVDYKEEDVKTEVKEVDSDYKKGVVIKIPFEYQKQMEDEKYPSMPVKVGDIIVYKYGVWFDLVKDTQLVRTYDFIGIER